MVERDISQEEEFWDGHSLKDNCPWEEYIFTFTDGFNNFADSFRKLRRIGKENITFDRLKQSIQSINGKPIQIIGEGEKLRLSDLPKGTIIRFSIDSNYPGFIGRNTSTEELIWGLTTQDFFAGNYFDVVNGYSEAQLNRKSAPYDPAHTISNDISVGETLHHRCIHKDSTSILPINVDDILRINRHQYLQRVNWIEVWQFGKEVREVAETRETVDTQRLLNPGLSERVG